jgi:hypothetical protein
MATTHELKTWPSYFQAVKDGDKTFEVRKNDRDFQVGDWLKLLEYNPSKDRTAPYTGREVTVMVTYVLDGGEFGIEKGYCVMGIRRVQMGYVSRQEG